MRIVANAAKKDEGRMVREYRLFAVWLEPGELKLGGASVRNSGMNLL